MFIHPSRNTWVVSTFWLTWTLYLNCDIGYITEYICQTLWNCTVKEVTYTAHNLNSKKKKNPKYERKNKKNWELIEKLQQTRKSFTSRIKNKDYQGRHFQRNDGIRCPEVKFLSPQTDKAHKYSAQWKTKPLLPNTVKLHNSNKTYKEKRIRMDEDISWATTETKRQQSNAFKISKKKIFGPESSN